MATKVSNARTNTMKKSIDLIIADSEMQGLNRKIFNVLGWNSQTNFKDAERHYINIPLLLNKLEWDSNNYQLLIYHLTKMADFKIRWDTITTKNKKLVEVGIINFFDRIVIQKSGVVMYKYTDTIRELVHDYEKLKTGYASIDLSSQKLFSRIASLAFCEFLLGHEKLRTPQTAIYEVEHFKIMMGVKDEYFNDFKKFNQKKLKLAYEDVENAGISCDIIETKISRKVSHIQVKNIKNKNTYEEDKLYKMCRRAGGTHEEILEERQNHGDTAIFKFFTQKPNIRFREIKGELNKKSINKNIYTPERWVTLTKDEMWERFQRAKAIYPPLNFSMDNITDDNIDSPFMLNHPQFKTMLDVLNDHEQFTIIYS